MAKLLTRHGPTEAISALLRYCEHPRIRLGPPIPCKVAQDNSRTSDLTERKRRLQRPVGPAPELRGRNSHKPPHSAERHYASVPDRHVRRNAGGNSHVERAQRGYYQCILRPSARARPISRSCPDSPHAWMGRMVPGDNSEVRPPWIPSDQPEHLL